MNTILAVTYCVIVRGGKRDEVRSRRSLWLVLGLSPFLCFLLAVKPLFDQAYNYTNFHVCGIAEHPLGCLSDNYDSECTRGANARELKIARFSVIFLANIIIVVSVCVLVKHVISKERRMASDAGENTHGVKSKVTWQGIFYVTAFWLSYGPWMIWQWMRITDGMKTIASIDSSALVYIISITYPLQGAMNAFVFFRPRYLKYRERDKEELRLASILRAVDINVPKVLSVDWWRRLRRPSVVAKTKAEEAKSIKILPQCGDNAATKDPLTDLQLTDEEAATGRSKKICHQ